ncbi:MAG: hypothetical protein JNK72_27210 [Myxococcales bacterium]|nr:hypothetical protein [Myxococcales bacterium]
MRQPRSAASTRLGLGALILGLVGRPAGVAANGRFPSAQHVVIGPGAASEVLALRTTFGVLSSEDGGARWHWRCEEQLGYLYTAVWDPPIELGSRGPDGTPLLVGLTDGLTLSLDTCGARPIAPLAGRFTGDLTRAPDGQTIFWVSSDQNPNGVAVSRDGGRTFVRQRATVSGVLFETIEQCPSAPARLYLTGVTLDEPQRAVLYRSDDQGDTLTEVPVALAPGVSHLFLSGVDAADPEHLWFRATLERTAATVLLESRDGGRQMVERFRSQGALTGFALRPDGRGVWVGSREPGEGLYLARGDGEFARVAPYRVACLRFHAGALYVCGDELSDGFALGRSTDEGRSVTPLLRLGAPLERPACAADSVWAARCDPFWPLLDSTLRPLRDAGAPDARDAPGDLGAVTRDAGPPPSASARGCGCETSADASAHGVWALGVALAMGLSRRRRPR